MVVYVLFNNIYQWVWAVELLLLHVAAWVETKVSLHISYGQKMCNYLFANVSEMETNQ